MLPGFHLTEGTQHRLDVPHSGAGNLVTHRVEREYRSLIKKLLAKSDRAFPIANANSVCNKARTNPLGLLGRKGSEALDNKGICSKKTFKTQGAMTVFSGDKAETRLRKGVSSLADVSRAVMGGYIIHPNATPETAHLV